MFQIADNLFRENDKSPYFSICIPAYRADRYIRECLLSIATQSYRNYEVVIVDDGSPSLLLIDSEMLSMLPACRVVRIENSGPYAARQKAFELACGKVILCVDSDDKLLQPGALSKIRVAFEGGADIVLFNASNNDALPLNMFDFAALGAGGKVAASRVWNLYTTSYLLNSLWCKAFKRTLYNTSEKRRPRLLMAEDRLQSLEVMCRAKSFVLIDEPLYYYRPNMASTTNAGYDPAYYCQSCYVEQEVIAFMEKRGMPQKDWAQYFLEHTSRCLLGIRYNCSLRRNDRMRVYCSMLDEPVLKRAFNFFEPIGLRKVDIARLELLRRRHFGALDLSMLPWKVGSDAKRLLTRSGNFK